MLGERHNLIHHDLCLSVTIISFESRTLFTLSVPPSEAENKGETESEHY